MWLEFIEPGTLGLKVTWEVFEFNPSVSLMGNPSPRGPKSQSQAEAEARPLGEAPKSQQGHVTALLMSSIPAPKCPLLYRCVFLQEEHGAPSISLQVITLVIGESFSFSPSAPTHIPTACPSVLCFVFPQQDVKALVPWWHVGCTVLIVSQ